MLSEMEDTVFDDDVTEMTIGARDRMKVKRELANQGFRDGISEGQEVKLQEGFNIGYGTASTIVFEVAKLRGEISAALTLHHLHKVSLNANQVLTLESLAQEASDLEKQCLKGGSIAKQHIDTFCHLTAKETKMEEESTLLPEPCDQPSDDSDIHFTGSSITASGLEACSHGDSANPDGKDGKNIYSVQSHTHDFRKKLENIRDQLKTVLSG